ncbi:MAG: hypothetical protein CVT49_01195 [candidate division Zixibacteria bacterium HGW-Zixibacteria-1]|nr:MAG: hypothetical protein CVT49_01195 [candidate division Zixibacteria bacterium HGW-Zixibacteria-1]
MRLNKCIFMAGLLVLIAGALRADDFSDMVTRGNKAYKEGNYQSALDYYHQAEVERPETPGLDYNIGTALCNEQKYEEAVDKLQKSLVTDNVENEALAHYNLGNVYYKMGDYQNAIMSFQRSLEINPDDIDAKYNLELARKMLKEQMKPEQQDQQQQQQQQKEQDKQDQEQQQPEEQEDQQQNQEQQQQQPQEPKDQNEMSEEDAERILNALKDDEKDLQKEQERFKVQGDYQGNDW